MKDYGKIVTISFTNAQCYGIEKPILSTTTCLRELPPPRGCDVVISTSFTVKAAKGPQREPKKDDTVKNQEWEKKQSEEKTKHSGGGQHQSIEDLIAKGQHFFNAEDYGSALSVYTHAIDNVTQVNVKSSILGDSSSSRGKKIIDNSKRLVEVT